jgi:hypothetical protein
MSEFGSNIDEKKEFTPGKSKYRKTEFLKLNEGEHRVRILDTMETKHYAHYIGFAYVKCLGDECPICQNNKKILYEHPEDYREVKGWNPRRDRYYINVMDKTLTKVCPKCGTEATPVAELCPACGTVLGQAAPVNKVKVLTGSRNFFEDLKVLSKTVRNEQDEILPINTYDWVLVTRGKMREKTTSPSPRLTGQPNNPEFNPEDLFNLEDAVIKLTPEEMLDLFNGASLKDIFTMRRATKQVLNSDLELDSENIQDEIKGAVDDIFKA